MDGTSAAVLALWERCREVSPAQRLLALLAAASPGADADELAALPLGEVHRRLLALRRGLLDSPLEAVARCPRCGEALEVRVEVEELLRFAGTAPPPRQIEVRLDDLHLTARLPTAGDLLAIEDLARAEDAGGALLARCVPEARRAGRAIAPQDLSPAEVEAIGGRLAAADPGAELVLALACCGCGESSRQTLDLPAFLAAELELLARRLLRQVHLLARAYAWREADILALTAARRHAYLEMLAQ